MFKKKIILILGAGFEQLPAYEICKKNFATIIGVDKDKDAPGLKLAKYKIITSIRNDKNLINKIKKLKLKISAVLTVANDIPEIYYKICKELKTKNISRKSAKLGSNKIELYKELRKNNILVPDFFIITNINQGKKIIKDCKHSFVLKPYDGRGSRGVNFIESSNNFEKLFQDTKNSTRNKKLILQKYIDGVQISSESLKFKDKIYTILSYRNYKQAKKFYPSIIENGGDIPLKISKTNKKNIDSLILKVSKILKIKDSPLKCDLILKKGKIYVIEATPRFGGGYVASHSSQVIYGVNFLLLYIKILLGIKINKINFKYKNNFLSIRFIFNKKSNIFKKVNKIDFQKFKKNIVHKVIINKPISFDDIIKSHADRKGCVLIKSNQRKDAIKIAEKITSSCNREIR